MVAPEDTTINNQSMAAVFWTHIGRNEPAEHSMQHFTGRYSIASISEQEMQGWQQTKIPLGLPSLNRFQPESFAVKHSSNTTPLKVLEADGAIGRLNKIKDITHFIGDLRACSE